MVSNNNIIIRLFSGYFRSKEIDWMPYFTQRLVDDFASHIRLYRRAMEKAKATANKEGEIIFSLQ